MAEKGPNVNKIQMLFLTYLAKYQHLKRRILTEREGSLLLTSLHKPV